MNLDTATLEYLAHLIIVCGFCGFFGTLIGTCLGKLLIWAGEVIHDRRKKKE